MTQMVDLNWFCNQITTPSVKGIAQAAFLSCDQAAETVAGLIPSRSAISRTAGICIPTAICPSSIFL
jgi:hypothetical protein